MKYHLKTNFKLILLFKFIPFLLLIFLFSCSEEKNSSKKMQQQNPSPLAESTRKHERIENKHYTGIRFDISDILGKSVEIYIPEKNQKFQDPTLIIHFHGASFVPSFSVYNSEKKFILATVNLGYGSSVYEREFLDSNQFLNLILKIKNSIKENENVEINFKEIFISSFSAGYGAVRAILRNEKNIIQINGIILLDGLHTDYIPENTVLSKGGKLNEDKLNPFLEFAKLAAERKKKFIITHSEIFPGTYASTTETADYLIQVLQSRRNPILKWGPLGMQQLSETQEGNFLVLGFAGNTAPDHIDHFHGLYHFWDLLVRDNQK